MARRRNGFTWVELVVILFIIGIALMLFLPLGRRGGLVHARQAQCMNHMAVNLAKAHIQFASVNGRYCGYVNSVGPDNKCVSWVVPLFPYIDRQDLANAWTTREYEWEDAKQTIPAKVKHPHTYIEVLICPANPPDNEMISPLSFVVNAGYAGDTQPECGDENCTTVKPGTGENPANGVFHDQYGPRLEDGFNPQIARSLTMQYIAQHDGASHTLLLSENVQLVTTWYTTTEERAPLGFVWYQSEVDPHNPTETPRRINWGKTQEAQGRLDFARPSSHHDGGVNVAFADGHGKFISESINYRVYKQLMTPASALSDDQNPPELDESLY